MNPQRLRRALVVGLALLTAPLAAAGAAHAEDVTWSDARGDMYRLDITTDKEEAVRAPRHANGDLRRVTVRHTDRAVVVRQKFAELARAGEVLLLPGSIRTDAVGRRQFDITAARGEWRGQAAFYGRYYSPKQCGVTHEIDYDADVAVIRIPHACLGEPRWVQVQLGAVHFRGEQTYLDDAHSRSLNLERLHGWTPRLRRS